MTLAVSPRETLASRILGFLTAQAADGFAEAVELQSAVPGYPLLIGATFPLSLLARALDQAAPDDAAVQSIVRRLLESLLGFGDEDGWRYFTLCPDIPPDADDLAQVAILLAERGHPDRGRLLAGPLRRLADNRDGPGRFRTWLVAAPDEAAEVDATWAAGRDPVHPEVVANVLYALLRVDAEAWQPEILAGARWLLECQEGGLWASYWYYGHGYGTHQVLRLLAALARRWPERVPGLEAARRSARQALLSTQLSGGGWEVGRAPLGLLELGGTWQPGGDRALETALCLSAMGYLEPDSEVLAARERAVAFLSTIQDPDGGFPAEPYYFTMGRMPHQSRCLTAAAVLTAVTSAGQAGG